MLAVTVEGTLRYSVLNVLDGNQILLRKAVVLG